MSAYIGSSESSSIDYIYDEDFLRDSTEYHVNFEGRQTFNRNLYDERIPIPNYYITEYENMPPSRGETEYTPISLEDDLREGDFDEDLPELNAADVERELHGATEERLYGEWTAALNRWSIGRQRLLPGNPSLDVLVRLATEAREAYNQFISLINVVPDVDVDDDVSNEEDDDDVRIVNDQVLGDFYSTLANIPPHSPRSVGVNEEVEEEEWDVVDSWEWGQGEMDLEPGLYDNEEEEEEAGTHCIFYSPPASPDFSERFM